MRYPQTATQRVRTILGRLRRVFDDGPKLLNCGIAQPSLLYATQLSFRPGNLASGEDFGRIPLGKASNSALRPAGGPNLRLSRLESGRNRPGSPVSGPEALLRSGGAEALESSGVVAVVENRSVI